MKHSGYSLRHSLVRMPLESHLKVISDVLDGGILTLVERRELLIDHELLAAQLSSF